MLINEIVTFGVFKNLPIVFFMSKGDFKKKCLMNHKIIGYQISISRLKLLFHTTSSNEKSVIEGIK